jgi:acyl carrier protein
MSTLESARGLVATALDLDLAEVGERGDLDSIPAWDSLGHMKVILALENALGRPLTSGELAGIRGVADIAALLGRSSP